MVYAKSGRNMAPRHGPDHADGPAWSSGPAPAGGAGAEGNVTVIMRRKPSETGPLAGLSPRGAQSLTGRRRSVSDPHAGESDDYDPIVRPPQTVTVAGEPRGVRVGPGGERLGRRIGYQ